MLRYLVFEPGNSTIWSTAWLLHIFCPQRNQGTLEEGDRRHGVLPYRPCRIPQVFDYMTKYPLVGRLFGTISENTWFSLTGSRGLSKPGTGCQRRWVFKVGDKTVRVYVPKGYYCDVVNRDFNTLKKMHVHGKEVAKESLKAWGWVVWWTFAQSLSVGTSIFPGVIWIWLIHPSGGGLCHVFSSVLVWYQYLPGCDLDLSWPTFGSSLYTCSRTLIGIRSI